MNIAIIPARGGSRRIPRKNIRPFHGRPIITYSIEAAKRSGLFDKICVSTDDEEIAGIACRYGADPGFQRTMEASADEIGTQCVASLVIFQLGYCLDERFDFYCVIYPCAPMMSEVDLQRGFYSLTEIETDYVLAVGPDGKDAGQFIWGRVNALMSSRPVDSDRTIRLAIPKYRVCDINTESDWRLAEAMFKGSSGI